MATETSHGWPAVQRWLERSKHDGWEVQAQRPLADQVPSTQDWLTSQHAHL